ncbi:unnamed protein product [Lactuca saligna]|uniref:Uncharacterized protein n=1 Tax=Lactuca saligna TaxID=75948 RepID=A0AA36E3D5_LACSI|nr:unnamed protein product [Lactuca saligna]
MLCYVQSVSGLRSDAGGKAPVSPDFGLMQGTRSQSVSGLRSDAGVKALVSPDFGPILGELTKLRGYGFQFWFQVLSFQKRSSGRLQCTPYRKRDEGSSNDAEQEMNVSVPTTVLRKLASWIGGMRFIHNFKVFQEVVLWLILLSSKVSSGIGRASSLSTFGHKVLIIRF